MIYKFIDENGTFVIDNPQRFCLYFPLTDSTGSLLSAISPNLAGDIKKDNEHFLTVPASIEDVRSTLLCRREFFFKAGKRVIRCSEPGRDTLEVGFLYQKVTKQCRGLEIEILSFIPHDIPVEVMRVRVSNRTGRKIPVSACSFIPLYGRSEKNLRDHRHVSSLLNRVTLQEYGITLKPTMIFDEKGHRANPTGYFVFGYEGNAVAPCGQYPTLDSFFGSGDILNPEAIAKDLPAHTSKLAEFDGKEACGALKFAEKKLAPGRSREFVVLMGITENDGDNASRFRRLNSPAKVEAALEATKRNWRNYLSAINFDFKNKDYNGWLKWVSLQPTLRKLFGCSFLPHFDYGKGGRGWRDLWQDALALLLTEPDKAGELIRGSFRGVRVDGSNATIITQNGDFIADRNKINRVWMDHGVWPYLTTRLYVNRTGKLDFLLSTQTYFRDHQLKRARDVDRAFNQKDFLLRDADGKVYHGSILEHILIQTLVQFFNVGSHNVTRLENADWNDGMDMAPDKGESVVFSFMYNHTIRDLITFLEELRKSRNSVPLMKEIAILLDRIGNEPVDYGDYRDKQERLERYFDATRTISGKTIDVPLERLIDDLSRKWEHGRSWLAKNEWLPEGFFNGYYDNNGRRAEGSVGGKVRMTLPPQVFAIMSGVANDTQVVKSWKELNKYLCDREHKGFRLNTDFGDIQMRLGRAFGFAYGDKENGAFFNHMSVMLANALYSRGFVAEGFQVFDSIRAMAMADKGQIPPILPEYFNSRGKGLYLFLTGSASWYIYTLTQEVLGIKFLLGDLLIEPKLLGSDLKHGPISARIAFNGRICAIRYSGRNLRADSQLEVKQVVCRGTVIPRIPEGFRIKTSFLTQRVNSIEVLLG